MLNQIDKTAKTQKELRRLKTACKRLLKAVQRNQIRLWEDTLELTHECVILEKTKLEEFVGDSDETETTDYPGIEKELKIIEKLIK